MAMLTLLLATAEADAETVTRKEAQNIAELFFNAARQQKMARPKYTFHGREYTTNHLFIPFYVFNHPMGGYVIVSAENKAYPILAFSTTGSLQRSDVEPGMRALLRQYARHIEAIRYDSRIPDLAIAAWQDIPAHIASILSAQTDKTDLLESWREVEEEIERAPLRADYERLCSYIYTPSQWDELVTAEFRARRNVMIGFATDLEYYEPAVVTGQRGDFFKIYFGQPSDGYYRLFATEYISQGEIALLRDAPELPEMSEVEPPFTFYDNYIEEIRREEEARRAAIQEVLAPTSPVVEWQGSGHFRVSLSTEVTLARVYNVAGQMIQEQYFRDTNVANINIMNAPAGFYVALITDIDGRTYGIKLYR